MMHPHEISSLYATCLSSWKVQITEKATAIFMEREIFQSWKRWNSKKFSQNQKFEFKKSFVLYCQNLLKVWTKVGLNLVRFERTKVSKMK